MTAAQIAADADRALALDPDLGTEDRSHEAYELIGTVLVAAARELGIAEERVRPYGRWNDPTWINGWTISFEAGASGRPSGGIDVRADYDDDQEWAGAIVLLVSYDSDAWTSPGTVRTQLRDLHLWVQPILSIATAVEPR